MTTRVENRRCVRLLIRDAADIAAIEQNQRAGTGNTLVHRNPQHAALNRDIPGKCIDCTQIQRASPLLVGENAAVNTSGIQWPD